MRLLRWFAPNRYCGLVVPALRTAGFAIATEGEDPADLVVAMDGQCAVAGFEFARRHRCPLLLYLWDLPPWRLGMGRPDVIFEWRGRVRRVPRILGGFPERSGYYSRLHFAAHHAAAVWAPSTLTASDLAARFQIEARVVPFCYDSTRFRPPPPSAERRVPSPEPAERRAPSPEPAERRAPSAELLSVSRLVPHKNHEALIRAAARMIPRPTVHLIGQGPEAGALERLAADLEVRLELTTEWQSDEAIVAAYQRATVVVAPSRFEGFGLTPMEGVASGVPTVASDIPPHREHLGTAAHYFRLEDELSLVAAIRAAMEQGPADPARVAHLTIEQAAGRFVTHLSELGVVR